MVMLKILKLLVLVLSISMEVCRTGPLERSALNKISHPAQTQEMGSKY